MAKMFYTLDEAAAKLGKSPDEVKSMAESGQIQEFRDRDRLMFKVEQIDLLAGGGEEEDLLNLSDTGGLEPLSLASSGSGSAIGLNDSGAGAASGISIFEDEGEQADASAQTQVTGSGVGITFDMDAAASGSGLMDLTREKDDTSLGADLLGDVYAGDTQAETGLGGELFETADAGGGGYAAAGAGAAAAVPMLVAYDDTDAAGSGLVGGLAAGMVVTLVVALTAVVFAMLGQGAPLLQTLGDSWMPIVGGLAGLTLVLGVVSWLIAKKKG
ncbi:MAG: helix-turn-helix domain-containing protein [Phycisphaerales bacterium]|jgi:hypothetical protein|nr:helix-turn-helix domain-containing protein [Phycisphaerales bacterium]